MYSKHCVKCSFYQKAEASDIDIETNGKCNEPRVLCDLINLSACPIEQMPMRKLLTTDAGALFIIPAITGKNSEYFRANSGKWTFVRGDLIIHDETLEKMKIETEIRNFLSVK
ncbi:MAG: hypothetical protein PHW79_06150 [Candidatus Marinimicrobia bacterium]|nr:hypothetical protein [Candidatus Neomarinimicrobiota bacterium]